MTDKKLLRIVGEFRAGILDGDSSKYKCAMVCRALQGYLSAVCELETVIKSGVVVYDDGDECSHMWLTLPDGRMLDPTIDQFNNGERQMPTVYLGTQPDWVLSDRTNQTSGGEG